MNLSLIQSTADSLDSQLRTKTGEIAREQQAHPTIAENALDSLLSSAEHRRQAFHREVALMVTTFQELGASITRIMNDKNLTGNGKFNAKLPLLQAVDDIIQKDLSRRGPGVDSEIRDLELKIKLQTISTGNVAADEARKIEIRGILRKTDAAKLGLQYIQACKNTDIWVCQAVDEAVPPLIDASTQTKGLKIRQHKEASFQVYSIEFLEILREHFLLLCNRTNRLLADLGFSSDLKLKPVAELRRQRDLATEAYRQRLEKQRKHAREQKRLGV